MSTDPLDPATTAADELPFDFFTWPEQKRKTLVQSLAYRGNGPPSVTNTIRTAFTGGDPNVIGALTAVVQRESSRPINRIALRGLTRAQDPAAIPGLLHGLDSQDHASAWHAINGLQILKAREAVPGLIELLGVRRLRIKAAEALLAIRDERALEPLRTAATHGWPRSRRTLREAADKLALDLGL